jgi:hypothetical protein
MGLTYGEYDGYDGYDEYDGHDGLAYERACLLNLKIVSHEITLY